MYKLYTPQSGLQTTCDWKKKHFIKNEIYRNISGGQGHGPNTAIVRIKLEQILAINKYIFICHSVVSASTNFIFDSSSLNYNLNRERGCFHGDYLHILSKHLLVFDKLLYSFVDF